MNRKNKRNIIKIVALTLVLSVIIGCVLKENLLRIKASEVGKIDFGTVYYDEVVNGVRYTLSSVKEMNNTCVYLRKSDSNNFSKIYYNNEMAIREDYCYKDGEKDVLDNYDVVKNVVDINTLNKEEQCEDTFEDVTRKITWNKAVETPDKIPSEKYWYKIGSEGKKLYYRIGCKAKYQIRTDNNSDAKKACENFATEVKDCREQFVLSETLLKGTKVTAVAIWAIVIVNIFFPVATIIEIVAGLLGLAGGSSAVVAVISSVKHYLNAKDFYVEARTYGKKYE